MIFVWFCLQFCTLYSLIIVGKAQAPTEGALSSWTLNPLSHSCLNTCVGFKFILISVSQISVYFNAMLLASSFSPRCLTPPQSDSLEDCRSWRHSTQMSSNVVILQHGARCFMCFKGRNMCLF